MVLLPEEQRIDQFAQFGKLSTFLLHPVRSATDRFIRPASEDRVDELVDGDGDLVKSSAHRVLSTVRSVSVQPAVTLWQAG